MGRKIIPSFSAKDVLQSLEAEIIKTPSLWDSLANALDVSPSKVLAVAPYGERGVGLYICTIRTKAALRMARDAGGYRLEREFKGSLQRTRRLNGDRVTCLPFLILSAPIFLQDEYECPEDFEFFMCGVLNPLNLDSQPVFGATK